MKTPPCDWFYPVLLGAALLGGCSNIDVHSTAPVQAGKPWLLLPLQNLSDTPKAGDNVRSLLAASLHSPGIPAVKPYQEPTADGDLPELSEQRLEDQALAWGKQQGLAYGLGGAVNEWRYKPGTGEPVIGVTLKVVDLQNGSVLWSATGARSGWAGSTASGTAQTLLEQMVGEINLD